MDFTTLKAYMTTTSVKENVNTTLVCVQKRLIMNKVARQTNRSVRLTQFRKIPENMSACNTPQTVRTIRTVSMDAVISKAGGINSTKLFEEKQKQRQQRLREFKEKKEKIKKEEANKKPMFKVTHASLENYDLGKVYNFLPNKGDYKFSAPTNIRSISFRSKTPIKAQESPRKRITRSTVRQQISNHGNNITGRINENASSSKSSTVNITKVEQMLVDSNTSHKRNNSNTITSKDNERSVPAETKRLLQTPSKVKNLPRKIEVPSTSSNTHAILTEAVKKLTKTPTKVRNHVTALPKTPRSLRKAASQDTSSEPIPHEKPKVLTTKTTTKTRQKYKSEELLVKESSLVGTSASPRILIKDCLKVKSNKQSSNNQKTKTIFKPILKDELAEENNLAKIEVVNKTLSKIAETSSKKSKTRKTSANIVVNPEQPISETKQVDKASDSNKKLKKNKSKSTTTDVLEPPPKPLKSENTPKPALESKVIVSERTDDVKSSLQASARKYRTRSNSTNTPSNSELHIDISKDLIQPKSPLVLKKSTPAKSPLAKNLNDATDNSIVNVENNLNEANTNGFLKTPENAAELGGHEEKINSLKTPSENRENEHCVYISPFVTISRGKNSARKEYNQRSIAGGALNSPGFQQSTNVKTAAEYFTLLLDKETNKINNNCAYWGSFKNDNNLPEEAVDMIDVAIGQGNLLRNKKMQTFRNLIQYSLEERTDKPVTCMDLHGYWDVLNMQIDNVSTRFENLSKMRGNNWKEILPENPKKTAPKKIAKAASNTNRSNALRDAIKSARLRAKTLPTEIVDSNSKSSDIKTPKSVGRSTRSSVGSAKGSHKRISSLSCTPRKSVISPRSGSPHIMMQISQVAKSVDRLGSEAVHSAKSILKKRQDFKSLGRKPKVVLFDVSDDVFEDAATNKDSNLPEKESPIVRRSTRLH